MTRAIDIQRELAPDPVAAEYLDKGTAGACRRTRHSLPHERDEAAREERIEVQDRLLRALDDLSRGLQDTDMHAQPGYPTREAASREPDAPH